MAGEIGIEDVSYVASSNVTALTYTGTPPVYSSGGIQQFAAVIEDTATGFAMDCKLAATTGALILGIAQDGPATGPGQSLRVRRLGRSKALSAGAVSYGDIVYVADSSGRLGTAPAPGATNVYAVGKAVTPATQANDLFEVELIPGLTTQVNA